MNKEKKQNFSAASTESCAEEKQQFLQEFDQQMHRLGKITLIAAVILLVSLPFVIGVINGVMPDGKGFLAGFAKV